MAFEIQQIEAFKTWPIRQLVMWPDRPLEYVQLPNDKKGRHYGLFIEQRLISIISLFSNHESVQFRKLATLNDFQGKGYGSILLQYVFDVLKEEHYHKIWCNARIDKSSFYHKFGMIETNRHFHIDGIDYVIMEKEL